LRLLLDTTYLLPAIGISVRGIPANALIRLIEDGHEIFLSDISVFELSAKGAKHVAAKGLSAERVTRGIRAVVYDETVTRIPIHESRILLTALRLRSLLGDFIDCLILSSAVHECDAMVTEDSDIQDLRQNREAEAVLKAINPKLQILALTEILTP